ncbi:hypothetical protein MIMGU_mgv1a013734mg [Erythranthe guttata]|uniref:Uncharacterized protein n=1 Tax=Erythranthe guttata TaxID=4155 RepID=A0A022Q7T3_ERYGU|nr:hypothetical protein MIMGU_mgv1a013734mg [Erythranthe guttata]
MSTEHGHKETQKREDVVVQTSRGYLNKFISAAYKTIFRQLVSIRMLNKKKHHTPPPPPAGAERDDQNQISSIDDLRLRAVHPSLTEQVPEMIIAITEAPPSAGGAAAQSPGSLSTIVVMKLEKLAGLDFVLTGLVIGFGSIMVGIVIRKFKPVAANVIEQLGIVIMLVSFNGLVASALPAKFAWVVIIFGGVYVSPFAIAIFVHAPADHVN